MRLEFSRFSTNGSQIFQGQWIYILAAVIGVALLSTRLMAPWEDSAGGWNGAWISECARNYLRYGLKVTGGVCVRNDEPTTPDNFRYYVHHPVGVPLLVALSFWMTADTEWAARLVPIFFSLGNLILVYLLAKHLFGRRIAMLALAFQAIIPMNIFAGSMVNHESPTGFFILLFLYFYCRWRSTFRGHWQLAMATAFLFGAQMGWPIYYLAALIPLHLMLVSRSVRAPLRHFWWLPLTACCLFGLFLFHSWWAVGDVAIRALKMTFLVRAGDTTPYVYDEQWKRLVRSGGQPVWDIDERRPPPWTAVSYRISKFIITLNTFPVVILAACWPLILIKPSTIREHENIIAILLGVGLTHLVLFRQGAYLHWYWSYYLSFGLVIAAARSTKFLMLSPENPRKPLGWQTNIRNHLPLITLSIIALNSLAIFHQGWGIRSITIRQTSLYDLARTINSLDLPPGSIASNSNLLGPQLAYYVQRRLYFYSELGEPKTAASWFKAKEVVLFALAVDQPDTEAWDRVLSTYSSPIELRVKEQRVRLVVLAPKGQSENSNY